MKNIRVPDNQALERKVNQLITTGYGIIQTTNASGEKKVYLNRSTMKKLDAIRKERAKASKPNLIVFSIHVVAKTISYLANR